jgi:hypothetical protein
MASACQGLRRDRRDARGIVQVSRASILISTRGESNLESMRAQIFFACAIVNLEARKTETSIRQESL